jgi:hypothetical protein
VNKTGKALALMKLYVLLREKNTRLLLNTDPYYKEVKEID